MYDKMAESSGVMSQSVGLEKSKNSDAALELREYMSELSEDYYCAGWLNNLEYSLWSMMTDGPGKWGLGHFKWEEVHALIFLSHESGGWWRWNDTHGDCEFLTMSEWRDLLTDIGDKTTRTEAAPSVGMLVTTSFDNKSVYLWEMSPEDSEFLKLGRQTTPEGNKDYSTSPSMKSGATAIVLEVCSDWVKVITSDRQVGWIGKWNLREMNE